MIAYADGTEARVGDHVDYDGAPGAVEAVIDSSSERAEWGLTENGLMLKTEREGLVFQPVGSCDWEAVVFLGRKAEPGAGTR